MPGETTRMTTGERRSDGLLALDATQLQAVLENRVVIQQAKGMLAERLGVTLEEASAFLRSAARSQGVKLDQLASEVVRSPKTPAEHLVCPSRYT